MVELGCLAGDLEEGRRRLSTGPLPLHAPAELRGALGKFSGSSDGLRRALFPPPLGGCGSQHDEDGEAAAVDSKEEEKKSAPGMWDPVPPVA